MESIGVVIYCQGFILPGPWMYTVRELGMCDLSGHHRCVYAYQNTGPSYEKLSPETKASVDKAIDYHGVPYQPKYKNKLLSARPESCLTDDFDQFVGQFNTKSHVGVWAGDDVGKAFLIGLGCPFVEINHNDLQTLPLGCVLEEDLRRNTHCSGHFLRQILDDDDSQMHRCSLEYACALSALVRKETHYRSPTLVDDLLYQKNLWQWRAMKCLDVMMCGTDCQAEMLRAFEKGQGLEYYNDCDTGHCWWVKRLFRPGVFEPDEILEDDFSDNTLDTLTVLTPPQAKN